MSDRNRAIVARFYDEVLNEGRLNLLDELLAPDFVEHGSPPIPPGIEGFRAFVTRIGSAFEDFTFTVEDWIATGDRVVARGAAAGTHRGDFLGFAATGRRVTWTAIHIWRVADGRLAERWAEADVFGIVEQLRAGPT